MFSKIRKYMHKLSREPKLRSSAQELELKIVRPTNIRNGLQIEKRILAVKSEIKTFEFESTAILSSPKLSFL